MNLTAQHSWLVVVSIFFNQHCCFVLTSICWISPFDKNYVRGGWRRESDETNAVSIGAFSRHSPAISQLFLSLSVENWFRSYLLLLIYHLIIFFVWSKYSHFYLKYKKLDNFSIKDIHQWLTFLLEYFHYKTMDWGKAYYIKQQHYFYTFHLYEVNIATLARDV